MSEDDGLFCQLSNANPETVKLRFNNEVPKDKVNGFVILRVLYAVEPQFNESQNNDVLGIEVR